jgi:hypothetical protein
MLPDDRAPGAAAYGSPVSAIRRRAAALILSCDIVPSFRQPVPALATAESSRWKETPREGCAALVLSRYPSAGLA